MLNGVLFLTQPLVNALTTLALVRPYREFVGRAVRRGLGRDEGGSQTGVTLISASALAATSLGATWAKPHSSLAVGSAFTG